MICVENPGPPLSYESPVPGSKDATAATTLKRNNRLNKQNNFARAYARAKTICAYGPSK